jgi:hypothetical protein
MAAMAWSTVSWMPKTFVSPVIRKIFSIRSRVQTRSSERTLTKRRIGREPSQDSGRQHRPGRNRRPWFEWGACLLAARRTRANVLLAG